MRGGALPLSCSGSLVVECRWAFEVARELGLPLDIFPVRKLGVPAREELAMRAIGSGGVRVLKFGGHGSPLASCEVSR